MVKFHKAKHVTSVAPQQCQWKDGAVETATLAPTASPLVAPVREGGRLSTFGSLALCAARAAPKSAGSQATLSLQRNRSRD